MAKVLSFEADIKGGATVRTKLIVPVLAADPTGAALVEGLVWFNSVDNLVRYYDGAGVISLGAAGSLDAEAVQDLVGAMVTGNTETGITVTYDDPGGKVNFAVTDSPTVAGATPAQLRDRSTHTGVQAASTISDLTEAVQDVVGAAATDTGTVNFVYDDAAGTLTAAVLDSPLLEGSTKAQVIASAVASIVDTAPTTLDTLNELAAALGDDPNFATTITALINARSKGYAAALTGGATSEVVTHNLGTRDLTSAVYLSSGTFEEEDYIVEHTTANSVTVRSEGGNIPAGRRIVLQAIGS